MKTLFYVIAFLLATTALQCKIKYYDFDPDSVLITVGMNPTAIDLDMNKDGMPDFYICHHGCVQFFSGYNGSEALTYEPQPYHFMPVPLNEGDTIKSGCTVWYNSNHSSMNMDTIWPGRSDKCIGLRFKVSNKWLYGWLKLSVAADGQSCVVKEFAYEDSPNVEVLAGDKGAASVPMTDLTKSKIKIYPNPAEDKITIEGAESGNVLGIYDIKGNIIRTILVPGPKFEAGLDDQPPGVYYIRYKNAAVSFIISQ